MLLESNEVHGSKCCLMHEAKLYLPTLSGLIWYSNKQEVVIVFLLVKVKVIVMIAHVTLQDGQIDAEELQRCLTSSGISGSYQS